MAEKKINWRKISKIGSYFICSLIIILAILVIFSAFKFPGNYQIMVVQSGSMKPAIKMGSLVVVKPTSQYKIGDIITYKSADDSQRTTTHRIVEINEEQGLIFYKTKGDANDAPDFNPIFENNIVGKILFSIPYLGYPVSFAKTLPGLIILIIIPATIIIYEEIRKIVKEVKKRGQKSASAKGE
jgi:signal peptidase